MSRTRGIRKANGSDVVFDAGEQGDAYPRIEIHADGTIWTGNGTAAPTTQLGAAPAAPGVPGTPVATALSATTAGLTWTAAAANGSPVTSYVVTPYIGATAQTTQTFGNVLSATATGLTTGTGYTFKVHAVNGVGVGSDTAASNAVTPATVPDAPTIGTATGGNASAVVTFTPNADGGSGRTGCRITPYIGATAQTAQIFATTATSQTVTALTNGSTYTFKVEDKNAIGYSAQSAATNSVTPAGAPFAPSDLGSKLKVYLEGEDLLVGAISAWASRSPATFNASQATSGAQAAGVAAQLNGFTIARLDGTNDFLTLGTAKILGEEAGDSFTVLYVYKIVANGSPHMILARDDNALGRNFNIYKSGNVGPVEEIKGIGSAWSGGTLSDGWEYHTIDAVAGGAHQAWVNGVSVFSGNITTLGNPATGPTDIGRRSYVGAESYAHMDLAAMYICVPQLTGPEIASMHTYIAARFGL